MTVIFMIYHEILKNMYSVPAIVSYKYQSDQDG